MALFTVWMALAVLDVMELCGGASQCIVDIIGDMVKRGLVLLALAEVFASRCSGYSLQ